MANIPVYQHAIHGHYHHHHHIYIIVLMKRFMVGYTHKPVRTHSQNRYHSRWHFVGIGVEFPSVPKVTAPLVADFSSSFMSQPIGKSTIWYTSYDITSPDDNSCSSISHWYNVQWWIDVSKFTMIYAGAQKNIGPAGVVIVIGIIYMPSLFHLCVTSLCWQRPALLAKASLCWQKCVHLWLLSSSWGCTWSWSQDMSHHVEFKRNVR